MWTRMLKLSHLNLLLINIEIATSSDTQFPKRKTATEPAQLASLKFAKRSRTPIYAWSQNSQFIKILSRHFLMGFLQNGAGLQNLTGHWQGTWVPFFPDVGALYMFFVQKLHMSGQRTQLFRQLQVETLLILSRTELAVRPPPAPNQNICPGRDQGNDQGHLERKTSRNELLPKKKTPLGMSNFSGYSTVWPPRVESDSIRVSRRRRQYNWHHWQTMKN